MQKNISIIEFVALGRKHFPSTFEIKIWKIVSSRSQLHLRLWKQFEYIIGLR